MTAPHSGNRVTKRPPPSTGPSEPAQHHGLPPVAGFRPVTGLHAATPTIRRTVSRGSAVSALRSILEDHGATDWYKDNWPHGVKAITDPVADALDTDDKNLKNKLRAVPTVAGLLRAHRMVPELSTDKSIAAVAAKAGKVAGLSGDVLERHLSNVWDTYTSLVFYHVTNQPYALRASGLDPDKGGSDQGKAATQSVGGLRQQNVANAKKRVYVTRKWSEARQYRATAQDEVLRILIPLDQQAKLKVDPDSMFGLYLEAEQRTVTPANPEENGAPFTIPTTLLRGIDRANRQLGPDAYYILQSAIQDPDTLDYLRELYEVLLAAGMFEPGREEEVRTL